MRMRCGLRTIAALVLMSTLGMGCSDNGTDPEEGPEITDLTGDYLGQQPPGATPVRFAPQILSPDSTWWWISPPKFSPDGNDMVFTKYIIADTHQKRLYSMERVGDDRWTSPEELPFGSEDGVDCHAAFSVDGTKLFFLSHRRGGSFFVVTKDGGSWSDPVVVSIPGLAGVGNQFSVTRDESIYFEISNGQNDDLYVSRLVDGEYSSPESLGAPINTTDYEDYAPFIDPDESYLIFASNRPGGFGSNDLYVSFHEPGGTWSEPQNLGSAINSNVADTLPCISPDGNYFFFITWKEDDEGFTPYWVDVSAVEALNPDQ